ncbi:hypothetical protein Ac2012v2_000200 [Leucoagaricus gongylophorus]
MYSLTCKWTQSKRIFAAMLDDIIFDVVIEAHHEVMKGKSVCRTCHTRKIDAANSPCAGLSSRADTPSSETGTGAGNGSKDGTILLDCVNCQRQIASNRYAPHLASCMGLSSARRAPSARNSGGTSGKPKLPSDTGRSASPASETGNGLVDRLNGRKKEKVKSKILDGKSRVALLEEDGSSLKRKRPQSPQMSPAKAKKAKASGSPVSRVKAEPDSMTSIASHYTPSLTGTKSKIPSKLRESSTTSFLDRSPTTVSSRSTSPAITPASSAFSVATQSPQINSRGINSHSQGQQDTGRGKGKVAGTGPPPRRSAVSPPRPTTHHSVVPDYGILDVDEGGDETGSSTDTDSD